MSQWITSSTTHGYEAHSNADIIPCLCTKFVVGLCSSPPLPEIVLSNAVLLLAFCVVCSASDTTAVTPWSGFAQHTPQYARTRMRRAFTCARLCARFFHWQGAKSGTALAVISCLPAKTANTLCAGPCAVGGCYVGRACPIPLFRSRAGTALGRTRAILALPLQLYRLATSAMRLWRST